MLLAATMPLWVQLTSPLGEAARAVADGVVAAADAFVVASKAAPTVAEVTGEESSASKRTKKGTAAADAKALPSTPANFISPPLVIRPPPTASSPP